MINVKCPHCGTIKKLNDDEERKLGIGGKVVVDCENKNCPKIFIVEDDGDCIFARS